MRTYKRKSSRGTISQELIQRAADAVVTTVLKPRKIVAKKGAKQVGAIVSAERGTLVTVELAANALGNTVPPMFVFPRLKYKDLFIKAGPPESIGAGNSSGWITATEFLIYMDHFIKHTRPTPSDPVLLLLDNHQSHVDINVVEKAKASSIVMLSFPPHCTHRLQPLDVGVNAPFKNYCAKAQDNWLRNNPGKTMSIYEIPEIVKYVLPLAATPINIMSSFRKTGIWPFNPNIFTDDDFAPSFVTDRPFSAAEESQVPLEVIVPNNSDANTEDNNSKKVLDDEKRKDVSKNDSENVPVTEEREIWNQPGPSWAGKPPESLGVREEPSVAFSPEIVRPFPKAPPRLGKNKRRIRKSAVLTDTPEKQALAEEQSNKRKKDVEKPSKEQGKNKGKGKGKQEDKGNWKCEGKGKGRTIKRQVLQNEDDRSDDEDRLEYYCIVCCDSYSNSRPGQEWVQCQEYQNWAHSRCQKNSDSLTYVCPNCGSDGSCDDLF